ncbi:MAG: CRISPR-associated protein Cas4 [Anaerolineae bacterium CG17_big_fil_post_rev_8_21_14_2_50_57_27]|nr:MAG: CRISPR-associated protein Cas4 [Anaerolineae bacterium CG06_land_8_20_14_3_00_57_67]PIW19824.1 MAG: CRISPR-associated protein Cas4 [Anaerolineae bacterium CG17_big_fil_post_rev_8_21_14_2_50_57_27]
MLAEKEAVLEAPFRVTDLKQWVYCPRILYYVMCLPDVRPVTYKMKAGVEAGREEEGREARRSLHAYNLTEGRREFNVPLVSSRLGLRGVVDMVIWLDEPAPGEVMPVDYKLSEIVGEHFRLQLAAYGLMLEEMSGAVAKRGFLYSIPRRRAEAVLLNERLRDKLLTSLDAMHRMLRYETMPAPTPQRNKCLACEFRRFCNDIY